MVNVKKGDEIDTYFKQKVMKITFGIYLRDPKFGYRKEKSTCKVGSIDLTTEKKIFKIPLNLKKKKEI